MFNDKNVIGLFGNDKTVEEAVNTLREQGFGPDNGEEITVLNQTNFQPAAEEEVTEPVALGTSPAGSQPMVSPIPKQKDKGSRHTAEMLVKQFRVSGEEAEFFGQQLARGNKLVVVKTDKDRAEVATKAMEEAGGRTTTS